MNGIIGCYLFSITVCSEQKNACKINLHVEMRWHLNTDLMLIVTETYSTMIINRVLEEKTKIMLNNLSS